METEKPRLVKENKMIIDPNKRIAEKIMGIISLSPEGIEAKRKEIYDKLELLPENLLNEIQEMAEGINYTRRIFEYLSPLKKYSEGIPRDVASIASAEYFLEKM